MKSPPATPDAQVALADKWWALAEQVEGKEKNALMAHADQWYGKALEELPEGFVKAKVKKRLEEVGKAAKIQQPVADTTKLPKEFSIDLGGAGRNGIRIDSCGRVYDGVVGEGTGMGVEGGERR